MDKIFSYKDLEKACKEVALSKDAECQQKMELAFNPDYLDFQKGVEVEKGLCQQRVERIFEEIEKLSVFEGSYKARAWQMLESEWQALRREVEDK